MVNQYKSNPLSGFKILLKEIERSPRPLNDEEERRAGALELYSTNKRYALSIAKKYFREGDDDWNHRALASALKGLYLATDTYDPDKENASHFKSYAHSKIMWEVNDELGLRSHIRNSVKGRALRSTQSYSEGEPIGVGSDDEFGGTHAKNFKAGAFDMQPEPTDIENLRSHLSDALRHISREADREIVQRFFAWGKTKATLKEMSEEYGVGISSIVQRRERGLAEMKGYLVNRFGKGETEKARAILFGLLGL